MKNEVTHLGDFLVSLLNLRINCKALITFLKECNEIIPVENMKDCQALIRPAEMPEKMNKAFLALPTEAEKRPGAFYKIESMRNFSDNKMTIGLYWIGLYWNTDSGKSETIIYYNGLFLKNLFEDLVDLQKKLRYLIACMANCTELAELAGNEVLIQLASSYPTSLLKVGGHSIEKKLDCPQVWDLRFEYIVRITSFAFFEFFLETKNFNRIKNCSTCKQFFVARDLKRRICYSEGCRRKYHRNDMRKRRDQDPVKYCR